jgi:hypothetical protein
LLIDGEGEEAMSQLMTIVPGAKVEANGRRFLITHLLDLEAVLAKDEESGRAERLFIKDLTPPKPERIALPREELRVRTCFSARCKLLPCSRSAISLNFFLDKQFISGLPFPRFTSTVGVETHTASASRAQFYS